MLILIRKFVLMTCLIFAVKISNQSILKEMNSMFTRRTNAEAEAPILWPSDVKGQLFGKDPDPGKDSGQEEKRLTENEMVGWHH